MRLNIVHLFIATEITKLFAGNPDVKFGDISLADGGPRGGEGANPGSGGWPTIR